MDIISELVHVCRATDTDKITERKRQTEKLKHLLNKQSLIRALDKNTDQKTATNKKLFGWDSLFKVVKNLIWKEAETIQKAKASQSASIQKKKQDIGSFFKFVVRLAEKRGPRLKGNDVVKHILEIMQDSFCQSAFGQDHTAILLKDILGVRTHCCELDTKQWHELLVLYCHRLLDLPAGFDKVIVVRTVHAILDRGRQQCDFRGGKIFPLLQDFFANIKSEKSVPVLEHIVSVTHIVCEIFAVDCRMQICELGEKIFIPLLYLWNNRPTDKMKDSLVDLYLLQLAVHHPKGGKTEADGAFAADWHLWKSHLRKLYESIYRDMMDSKTRNRFSVSSRDLEQLLLKENYLRLAIELCNQLFTGSSSLIEVTQNSFLESQMGSAAKKRRVESGWGVLRDTITQAANALSSLPWLQLLCELLSRYPSSVPNEEVQPCLAMLHQLLSDCKKIDVTRWLLRCLVALATAQVVVSENLTEFTQELCHSLWHKIWANSLRVISLRHAETEAFALLTALLTLKLVVPDLDVWSLFAHNLCKVSTPAVTFVAQYISLYELPEKHLVQGILASFTVEHLIDGKYPLRSQLLEWLLSSQDSDVDDSPVRAKDVHLDLLGELLVALTLRNTRLMRMSRGASPERDRGQQSASDGMDSLQELYLLSSFKKPLAEVSYDRHGEAQGRHSQETTHLKSLQCAVLEHLFRDARWYMDIAEPEVANLEGMAAHCCLLANVVNSLLHHGAIARKDLLRSNIVTSLKALMEKVAVSFVEKIKQSGPVPLRKVTQTLTSLYDWRQAPSFQSETAAVCRHVTPMQLIDSVMVAVYDKFKMSKQTSLNSTVSLDGAMNVTQVRRASTMDDLGFDDFGMGDTNASMDAENSRDAEIDDFDMSTSESQDSETLLGAKNGFESPFSAAVLNERETCQLELVDLLCRFCGHNRLDPAEGSLPPVDTLPVVQRIVNLVSPDEGWDAAKPCDLQMMVHITEGLSSEDRCASDEEIEGLQDALRSMCKQHKNDQAACCVAIRLLSRLVTQLKAAGGATVSASRAEARDIALHLLKVFWKFSVDGQYVHSTRLALAGCVHVIIESDPDGLWSQWSVQRDGEGDARTTRRVVDYLFPKLLGDRHHAVRLCVARHVKCMFQRQIESGLEPVSGEEQRRRFDCVHAALSALMTSQDRDTAAEGVDEQVNRTSGLLLTLANLACSSPVCEKRTVFAICRMAKEHLLDVRLVKQVLGQIATTLQYTDLDSLMNGHLPYLLHHWLENKYAISDFNHELFGSPNLAAFYGQHYKTIIPYLVMNKKLEDIGSIGRVLEREWRTLVAESVPTVLVHILPLFAASKLDEMAADPGVRRRVRHANEGYDVLTKIVKQQDVEQSIVNNLQSIVVDMLMTLHDPEYLTDTRLIDRTPEPSPPSYMTLTVTATLDYLTEGHTSNAKSLVALLSKSQDGIQRILLALSTQLFRTHCLHEKLRVLFMYRLFVKLVLKEFHDQLGGSWAFVLRDVIYTLLHVIQGVNASRLCGPTFDSTLVVVSCEVLGMVCRVALECCTEEMGRFLSVILSTLVPLACGTGHVAHKCVEVIQFLLVENAQKLREPVARLDPLPEHPAFTAANQVYLRLKQAAQEPGLKQDISHFLEAGRQGGGAASGAPTHRLDGLRHLHRRLSRQKPALAHLVTAAAQGDQDTLLVTLVYELIQLSRCPDPDTAQEAGRCLGEVGPVELPVIALKDRPGSPALQAALQVYGHDSRMMTYCHVIHRLYDYLVDSSIDTVVAAGTVLKEVLATKTGVHFYTDYKTRIHDHVFQYLLPFKSSKKKIAPLPDASFSLDHFNGEVDVDVVWCPPHLQHDLWVQQLVCKLIGSGAVNDEVLRLLSPVCKVKTAFSELVLPYVVHDILIHGTEQHQRALSHHVARFFQRHCRPAAGSSAESGEQQRPLGEVCISDNKQSVKTMLSVIQYLRLQENERKGRGGAATAWDNNFWLDVDYLEVAKAAYNCDIYFTAVLYSEIWHDVTRDKEQAAQTQSGTDRSSQRAAQASQKGDSLGGHPDALGNLPHPSGINVQDLLLQAYHSIGDPDGIYGCGAGRVADTLKRIKTYEHEKEWGKALGSYDLEIGQNAALPGVQVGLLKALQNFGTTHVLNTYLQGLERQGGDGGVDVQDFQCEVAWRQCQWDLQLPSRLDESCTYNRAVYSSLTALRDGDYSMAEQALTLARLKTLQGLPSTNMQSIRSLYPTVARLQCLNQVQDVTTCLKGAGSLDDVIAKWDAADAFLPSEFDSVEPVLWQRHVLLDLCRGSGQRATAKLAAQGQLRLLERLSRHAREAGRHQLANQVMSSLRVLDGEGTGRWSWRVEEARTYWARGEQETAKHLLKQLILKLEKLQDEDMEAAALYPQSLGIYGNWLAETRSENPNVVMDNYLCKATHLLEMMASDDDCTLDAFLSLARYADNQHQQLVDYSKSSTFEAKEAIMKKAQEEVDNLKRVGEKSRYLRTLEKQCAIDAREVATLAEDRNTYLLCAVENYLKCLYAGDTHNMRVFRLTSLWFDNAKHPAVNAAIKQYMAKIPSYKFLALMYQLAARMSAKSTGDEFQPTLQQLIERVVVEHPHHTLFIILALAHANKDKDIEQNRPSKKSSGRLSRNASQSSQTSHDGEEDRVLAAKAMVDRLRTSGRADVIQHMEKLSLCYIQLANWSVEQYKRETRPIPLPDGLWLTKLEPLRHVAVPTVDTKVDPTGEYKNIVYVQGFESSFKLAGGINLPKIITCLGSDGRKRRQLVKGKDDLRQDAVMQQVFGMVNMLLDRKQETRRRRLSVRTYKVIPLSQRSGLLEWCEGTVPVGDYLISPSSGAHGRYRPQDWTAKQCRDAMNKVHADDFKTKFGAYMRICSHFKPVFRHFFMEKFADPDSWYGRRLAYTRSVATNSVVGYILGLGDRHVQNILIDTNSAEMVHIDLGVAFEQGRILNTPETVPFRLTRDIVDGMGVTGVEGVFRRCCEKTMEVMHSSKEALLTILQVLLYDPLYDWTISPERAYQLQQQRHLKEDANITSTLQPGGAGDETVDTHSPSDGATENVNRVAERVLLRLQQKLEGVEGGVQLSVSGQVNHLLQEAMDPKNLCRLFPGWQPYI